MCPYVFVSVWPLSMQVIFPPPIRRIFCTFQEYGCKSFWAFGRQTGSVQVLLTLDRSGYVPGECIDVNAEIVNNSKKKLKSSMVQLRQGVLYKTSGGRTKETFQIIADLHHGAVQPSSIDQWEREPLTIPPVPPSFLRGSENISLKYELIFTVPDAQITLVVPIIIGTLPYHPDNMRRIMKALPWHAPEQECIYGAARPVLCPQPPQQLAPVREMPTSQPYYNDQNDHDFANDENRGPSSIYTTDDDDENNNYDYRNGFKQRADFEHHEHYAKQPKKPQTAKLCENGQQEPIYRSKNDCYYYNEQPRFLKIEELD